MVIILIISVAVTAYVWSNAGPVWGLVTGFLLIGGAGWKLLTGFFGLALRPFRPGWGEFVRAWENKIGDPRRSGWDVPDEEVLAMHQGYRAWRRHRKQTDESANDWLDRMAREGRPKPEFSRHVPLYPDGKGATFEFHRENGEPKWSWTYDPGTPDNFDTTMLAEMKLTTLQKELGLPLSFPHWDPDREAEKPKPPTEEEKARQYVDLVERADDGDTYAQASLWELDGTPITDPKNLKVGHVYYASFDLCIYRGTFVGRRYEGFPEIDDKARSQGVVPVRDGGIEWGARRLPNCCRGLPAGETGIGRTAVRGH